MFRLFLILIIWAPLHANACSVHADVGLSFITEPGSLSVFKETINERRNGRFTSLNSPEHAEAYLFNSVQSNPRQKISFVLFEPITGHYSDIRVSEQTQVLEREILPSTTELLLIAELDVLEALAVKQLSWQEAKNLGLVRINGYSDDIAMLDHWFTDLF